jgi:hypothetical protein
VAAQDRDLLEDAEDLYRKSLAIAKELKISGKWPTPIIS